jgi:type IV pilus assembly protein PilV
VSRRRRQAGARTQSGSLLIEVLVALLICAFGLLGFVGMQARAASAEFEAFQRSQALVLVEDIASRLNANRAHAGEYVTGQLLGDGALEDCSALVGSALDLCEWSNEIRGSAETRAGSSIGAMISARGCITRSATSSDRYLVSVVWQGILPTAGATTQCGAGDPAFPVEATRRAAMTTVCVGLLRDPAVAPPIARC